MFGSQKAELSTKQLGPGKALTTEEYCHEVDKMQQFCPTQVN